MFTVVNDWDVPLYGDMIREGIHMLQEKTGKKHITVREMRDNPGYITFILFSDTEYNKDEGFLVVRPLSRDYCDSLHIYSAYSNRKVSDAELLEIFKELDSYAKHLGFDKLTFTAGRKGWARKAKQLGFEPEFKTDFYVRKV